MNRIGSLYNSVNFVNSVSKAFFSHFPATEIRVKFFGAIRTDSVTKLGIRAGLDERFELDPVTFGVADFFATCADREKTVEGFYFGMSLLDFC